MVPFILVVRSLVSWHVGWILTCRYFPSLQLLLCVCVCVCVGTILLIIMEFCLIFIPVDQWCTILSTRSTRQLNFIQWHLIFVHHQHRTYFISPFWHLEF